jgi:hypothetical protein
VCFLLAPQTKPAFLEGFSDPATGPSNVVWEVAVSKELSLTLVAIDSSGDDIDIVLLPSPCAPNGARLSSQAAIIADERLMNQRVFLFAPTAVQVGFRFQVSFQPRSRATPETRNMGDRRDQVIQVAAACPLPDPTAVQSLPAHCVTACPLPDPTAK